MPRSHVFYNPGELKGYAKGVNSERVLTGELPGNCFNVILFLRHIRASRGGSKLKIAK